MKMIDSGAAALNMLEPVEFDATTTQSYFWRRNDLHPGDPCLNIAARWRVEGPISIDLMERGWQALVDRHEILRTVFVERGDKLVQHVLPHVRFRIRHVDLRGTVAQDVDALSERLGREEAAMPFKSFDPPLLRITILQQADDRAHMLLTTHHLAGDCWANLTLVREFGEICDALTAGKEPTLPEVTMQFGDYASWQNAWLAAGGAAGAEQYWAERLKGLSNFTVPTDRSPPATPTRRGDIFGVMVPPGVVETALVAARAKGSTFFAFGLATLTAVLHRWTGQSDIVVTTQIAGRDELELETVVGPFINTLALRGHCSPETRFADLLDQTLVTVGEALENGGLPFEKIVERIDLPRGDRRGALNGINFQVLNTAFLKDSKAGDVALKGFPSLSPGAKRDLDVYLVERAVGWRAQCEYDPDLFDEKTVEWVVQTFVDVLAAAGSNPERTLAELPVTPPKGVQTALQSAPPAPVLPVIVEAKPAAVIPAVSLAGSDHAERLTKMWSQALNCDDVPPNANFFEMGGDSMRAARLIVRIHDEFGQRLGLARFFQSPTLAGVAERLGIQLAETAESVALPAALPDLGQEDEDWRIMEVSPPGSKTPIIGINSVGTLFSMSGEFGVDRHIFGVRLYEPGKEHEMAGKTFQEIAAEYIKIIRRVEPHGPYILFGLCVHGVLALEIAHQLRDAGERIEILCFVNAWHPTYDQRMNFLNRQLARLNNVNWNFKRVLSGEKSFVGFLANYRLARKSGLLQLAARLGIIKNVPSRTGSETNDEFLLTLMRARDAYEPRKYDGTVVQLLGPDTPRWPGLDRSMGWKGIMTGPFHLHYIPPSKRPGTKDPSEPDVDEMVEQFRRILQSTEEKS